MQDVPKLERVRLDGTERKILVSNQRMVRPHALTLDFVKKEVYWADSYLDRIERVDYDGNNRKLVVKKAWVSNQLLFT